MKIKQEKVFEDKKLKLPGNVLAILEEILKDLSKVNDALHDLDQKDYQKAVQDLLAIVESIIVDLVLPKIAPKKTE